MGSVFQADVSSFEIIASASTRVLVNFAFRLRDSNMQAVCVSTIGEWDEMSATYAFSVALL